MTGAPDVKSKSPAARGRPRGVRHPRSNAPTERGLNADPALLEEQQAWLEWVRAWQVWRVAQSRREGRR